MASSPKKSWDATPPTEMIDALHTDSGVLSIVVDAHSILVQFTVPQTLLCVPSHKALSYAKNLALHSEVMTDAMITDVALGADWWNRRFDATLLLSTVTTDLSTRNEEAERDVEETRNPLSPRQTKHLIKDDGRVMIFGTGFPSRRAPSDWDTRPTHEDDPALRDLGNHVKCKASAMPSLFLDTALRGVHMVDLRPKRKRDHQRERFLAVEDEDGSGVGTKVDGSGTTWDEVAAASANSSSRKALSS